MTKSSLLVAKLVCAVMSVLTVGTAAGMQANLDEPIFTLGEPWPASISFLYGPSGSSGSYQRDSYDFALSLTGSSEWSTDGFPTAWDVFDFQAMASGTVLGNRNVLDGSFTLSAAIPELGLTEATLLIQGTMVDIYWGERGGGEFMQILFRNDVVHNAIGEYAGSYGLWEGHMELPSGEEAFCCDTSLGSYALVDVINFYSTNPLAVPLPGAAWLFGSALGLLAWMRRKIV